MERSSRERDELEEGLRRVEAALSRLKAEGPAVVALRPRQLRKLEKVRSRLLARGEEEEASVAHAAVFGTASLVAAFIALTQPHLWWLFFVAFGFGISGADQFAKARRRQLALPSPPPLSAPGVDATGGFPVSPPPPVEEPAQAAITVRLARVDGICEKLLGELKGAPRVVREMIRKPEETVEALRAASHELARRERELRGAFPESDGERLRRERTELEERIAEEADAVVRARLTAALEALDTQLSHRASLATAAARIEAEGTRILYSLENLRAQVLRTWAVDAATGTGPEDELRGSLELLSREMDAVASALEEVHSEAPLPSPGGAAPRPRTAETAGRRL